MHFQGTYTGLGQTARLGIGFEPDAVKIVSIGTANFITLEWQRAFQRAATGAGGIVRAGVGNTPGFVVLAAAAGIQTYRGGDKITASSLAYQIAARDVEAYRGNLGGEITRWTLGSSANRTGNFDAAVATAKCGVGSPVEIGGKLYFIQAISNSGNAANEVTLDRAAPAGVVTFLGAKLDLVSAPVDAVMPAGIELLDVTYVNVASTVYFVEAWADDK